MTDYTSNDLEEAYKELGVKCGDVVFVEGDMASLGRFEKHTREGISKGHLDSFLNIIDENEGTLVVSSATDSLVGTDTPFDIKNTPSGEGIFSEYLRQQPRSIRSLHPFGSYSAIGRMSSFICDNVSLHPYGPESPMGRMIDLNARYIVVGFKPYYTLSPIHHMEMVMGVPYRYVKEFRHPIITANEVNYKNFYLHLCYLESKVTKDSKKIWEMFECSCEVLSIGIGRGKVHSYLLKDFYEYTSTVFRDDPYIALDREPIDKPYNKTM